MNVVFRCAAAAGVLGQVPLPLHACVLYAEPT